MTFLSKKLYDIPSLHESQIISHQVSTKLSNICKLDECCDIIDDEDDGTSTPKLILREFVNKTNVMTNLDK